MKTLIVIQARTGSARLPNKVMLPLAGAPLLQRMTERVRMTRCGAKIVVATSFLDSDDPIRALCRRIGVECHSGHPTDLLDRNYRLAQEERADVVVKISSDCPLIDPAVIDRIILYHRRNEGRFDFVGNLRPATYPDGNGVEVMSFSALEHAWREARLAVEREHVTPFIWNRPDRFTLDNLTWEAGVDYSMTHRWTVDYPEDYEFVTAVYDELFSTASPYFSLYEILSFVMSRPDIQSINERRIGGRTGASDDMRTTVAAATDV